MADVPLATRVEILEAKVGVLEQIPIQIAQLGSVLREEIRAGVEETRRSLREETRAGDEETRRQMRVLHEDLVERLKTIGEAINQPGRKPRR